MTDQACDLFGDYYAFLVRIGVQRKRRPPSTLYLTRSACSRAGGGIRWGALKGLWGDPVDAENPSSN